MTGEPGILERGSGRALRWSALLRDVRAVVAGASAVLVTAVGVVVAHGGDPATADTYLRQARAAALVLHDGTVVDARAGMRVPDGATVRTGAAGGAVLETGSRAVYLGALSTLAVLDGVDQRLERGQVLVDDRGAAALGLATRAGLVRLRSGSEARVETGPLLRLGVFAGSARLTLPGRQATSEVPRLHQVLVPYAGRPAPPTALALRDDAWEQRVVPELVAADRELQGLARGLAGTSASAVLTAAPVALRAGAAATSDAGENALAVAVAQASRRTSPVADTLTEVQRLRAEGGSWGVVAALVTSPVTAVSRVLDAVLTPPQPDVQAGPAPDLPALLGGATPSTGGTSGGATGGATGGRTSGGTTGGTTGATPSPTTTRTPPPPPPSADPVTQLVTTITGLLSPSPRPPAPSAVPTLPVVHVPLLK